MSSVKLKIYKDGEEIAEETDCTINVPPITNEELNKIGETFKFKWSIPGDALKLIY